MTSDGSGDGSDDVKDGRSDGKNGDGNGADATGATRRFRLRSGRKKNGDGNGGGLLARFQPSALGLTGIVVAAMAVTLLLLQAFTGTFRTSDPPVSDTPAPEIVATPPKGTARLMIAGDSLAQGSSGDYTWRYRLWRHLADAGADVDFVGPSETLLDVNTFDYGDTRYADPDFDRDHYATWGASAADVADGIGEEVVKYEPHYLLLMAGTNDLVKDSTPKEALEHLRDAVSTARVARGDLQIVLGELPPMWGTGRDKELNNAVAKFNSGLPRLAEQLTGAESPVIVAHTAEDYAPADDNWDTTHPNARGELKIAAAFADALANFYDFGRAYSRPLPDVEVGPRDAPEVTADTVDGGVHLSWKPVPGATRYQVLQRRIKPDPDELVPLPTEVDGAPNETQEVDIGSLFSGAEYEFIVQPYKGDDPGVRSEPVEATADTDPPAAPEWVRLNADQDTLTWADAPDASHYAVWRRALLCTGGDAERNQERGGENGVESGAEGGAEKPAECEPRDAKGPSGGAGWTRMAVIDGDRRWPIIPGPEQGYEFVVVSHRDFIEGETSTPVELLPKG